MKTLNQDWRFRGILYDVASDTNDVVTAELPAQGAKFFTRAVKVDASYSDRDVSGLLTIKSGDVTIAEKYIHGAGALDFTNEGFPALQEDEEITASLADGGSGVVGTVYMSGYYHPENA